jgi:hypothetical protein
VNSDSGPMQNEQRFSELQPNWERALQAFLLIVIVSVPVLIMKRKSATFDEVAHLPAGFSYLTTGVVKLNLQHPPLIKEIGALPLLFLNPKGGLEKRSFENQRLEPADEWKYGREFLYSQDADRLLFFGRIPVVLLSLSLAVLVMVWSRKLWGGQASLLALFLYAFDPTITAHAQVVTTDVGFAFFATLYLFFLWKHLESPSRRGIVLSGLFLGLALGAKFSAVILIPMTAILLGLAAWVGRGQLLEEKETGATHQRNPNVQLLDVLNSSTRGKRTLAAVVTIVLILALASMVLWAIYLFPATPLFYFSGLKIVNQDHDPNFPYYLMGELKPGGWRTYFLIAWLIKTPIPFLLLLVISVALFLKGTRACWFEEAFLVIPPLSFFVGYSLTADNVGVRYLIPCFPFFFIFTARILSPVLATKKWMLIALGVLLGWYLVEFLAIYPDHLSYFNEIAGGSRHGPEWLDDSNVDWGQGLIQLQDYVHCHPEKQYWLCYFGSVDPKYYRIPARILTDEVPLSPPSGVTLILSGHCLARLRALMMSFLTSGSNRWALDVAPKAVVGHAYYVYEF